MVSKFCYSDPSVEGIKPIFGGQPFAPPAVCCLWSLLKASVSLLLRGRNV